MQLNPIGRLKRQLGKKELEVIVKSFIYSNFNYCPLIWHHVKPYEKQKILINAVQE